MDVSQQEEIEMASDRQPALTNVGAGEIVDQ